MADPGKRLTHAERDIADLRREIAAGREDQRETLRLARASAVAQAADVSRFPVLEHKVDQLAERVEALDVHVRGADGEGLSARLTWASREIVELRENLGEVRTEIRGIKRATEEAAAAATEAAAKRDQWIKTRLGPLLLALAGLASAGTLYIQSLL